MNTYTTDVLIIGAGQAGLAMAYYLQDTNLQYRVVDRHVQIGTSWRKRYDSLTLFTPRAFSALPGMPLSGDPQGYATRDEFADYLEAYAHQFAGSIHLNEPIHKLETLPEGFRATTETGGVYLSRVVVLATGAFQEPKQPVIAHQLSPEVKQFTASTYRNSAQLQAGRVLVVGDGATGRDIASELSHSHEVWLATGRSRRLFPERLLGQSIWWWFGKLGLLRVSADTRLGRYMKKTDPFPDRGRRLRNLRQQGVHIVPYVTKADGKSVRFANGEIIEVDTVIWAVGYRDNSDWVTIPEVKDQNGNFIHRNGIAPVASLYFIGRPWQRTRGSALIMGVGDDAREISEHILKNWNDHTQPAPSLTIRAPQVE